ncbi:MAG: PDZ domain-containing protein [Myxococcota bacterium]
MRRWMVMTAAITVGYACGGAAPASEPPPSAPPASPPQAEPEPAAAPAAENLDGETEVDGRIAREELLPVLDAGLGRFLQGVRTEPHLRDGRFVGFRLLSLWPEDPRFQDAGLERGDVIVRVNGQPIERPEQALQVWNGLRVASALYIELLRDGDEQELRFAIVD